MSWAFGLLFFFNSYSYFVTIFYWVCYLFLVYSQDIYTLVRGSQWFLNCNGVTKYSNFLKVSITLFLYYIYIIHIIYTSIYTYIDVYMYVFEIYIYMRREKRTIWWIISNIDSKQSTFYNYIGSECVFLDVCLSVNIMSCWKQSCLKPMWVWKRSALHSLLSALALRKQCLQEVAKTLLDIWGIALLKMGAGKWRPRKLFAAAMSHWPELEEEYRQSPS